MFRIFAASMGVRQIRKRSGESFSCRTNATFYNWRSKYGGMDASLMSEMKAMSEENRRLKKMYAEMAMQNELLKDALEKK